MPSIKKYPHKQKKKDKTKMPSFLGQQNIQDNSK